MQAVRYNGYPAMKIGDEILQFLNELHQFNPKITGGKAVDASLLG